jgi:hypothetical protein
MKKPFFFLLAAALFFLPFASLAAQQKYALVIGNGAYTNFGRLGNPVNDAGDMKTAPTCPSPFTMSPTWEPARRP